MNPHMFREYDIRGVVGHDLTDESVYTLARALGTFFRHHGATHVSLGRDARESSPRFRDLCVRGLTETGCDVLDVGMVPTPVLYFTLFTQDVDAGVMITGSHNPADNNGFKICLGQSSLFGDQILAINLSSAFHLVRAAFEGMKARKFGRIVNISSAHGLIASPFKAAYVAAKHGIVGFTKVIALEGAEAGVTSNASALAMYGRRSSNVRSTIRRSPTRFRARPLSATSS